MIKCENNSLLTWCDVGGAALKNKEEKKNIMRTQRNHHISRPYISSQNICNLMKTTQILIIINEEARKIMLIMC